MPDLAVIMSVCYKDKLVYVRESVESILKQTYSQFYFFIAYDGPVDENVNSYLSSITDKRLRIYKLSENKGLAVALNHLLHEALKSNEYLYFARMDADDISISERFEKQRNFLLSNTEVSCVGSWFEEIDESGRHLTFRKLPVNHENLKRHYLTRTPFAHSSVMYRREMIVISGFYPVNTMFMEDNVLWGIALKHGFRFANIPEYLLQFRRDKDFLKRRSGIKYGLNYIKNRWSIMSSLSFPLYSYLLVLIIGIIKMAPECILKSAYKLECNSRH